MMPVWSSERPQAFLHGTVGHYVAFRSANIPYVLTVYVLVKPSTRAAGYRCAPPDNFTGFFSIFHGVLAWLGWLARLIAAGQEGTIVFTGGEGRSMQALSPRALERDN